MSTVAEHPMEKLMRREFGFNASPMQRGTLPQESWDEARTRYFDMHAHK